MKHVRNLLFLLTVAVYSSNVFAEKLITIKIATLDNFTLEKYAALYKDSYYAGINTAVLAARKQGYHIEFKTFTYGDDPLAIFNAIRSVKQWHPDVIIGPHYSNQFLLLKNQFKNTLVLSPYATDQAVSTMPKNFYSLGLPDSDLAQANFIFIQHYFPKKNIFNVSQLDCKDCIDTTNNLNLLYKSDKKISIKNATYLGSNINSIDIKKLMQSYSKNSVIILQPLNELDATILITKIASMLKNKHLVFLYNVDNWGSNKNIDSALNTTKINAKIYRLVPWIINPQSLDYQYFSKYYFNVYRKKPMNGVSYMTYRTIMSIIAALKKSPKVFPANIQKTILNSYINAVQKNKNWYRITSYATYQYHHHEYQLLTVIQLHEKQ